MTMTNDENEALLKLMGSVSIGDDLYGLSIKELQARIDALNAEVERTYLALTKKRGDMSEAETLFAPRKTD